MTRQRGISLAEVAIAIVVGTGLIAVAAAGTRQYQVHSMNGQLVLTVREMARQSSSVFGGSRTGYPVGTIVPQELVRAGRLPSIAEPLATAGNFALPGGITVVLDVAPVPGGTRNPELRMRFVFPEAGAEAGPCRHLARAVRGWATRVYTPTGVPVDGAGQWLGTTEYEAFFATRCAVDGATFTAFFR